MTKKSIAIVMVLAVASITVLPAVSIAMAKEAEIKKDLRMNMRDKEVVNLQKELKGQGFLNTAATGFFGARTEKAVKDFQKSHKLPQTGVVDQATRNALNSPASSAVKTEIKKEVKQEGAAATMSQADMAKEINMLKELVSQLKAQIAKLEGALKMAGVTTEPAVPASKVDPAAQAAAGVIITGGVSGPGYPTGPLNLTVPATQLLFDRAGQVKQGVGTLEVKDRQYEAPLETMPPTMGAFPVTINGVANTATQLKVISNLKTKNGVGQHQGTIDVDIDTVPAGHVTLAYSGTATVSGSTIISKGTFKTAKTTGIFAGLVADGTYEMTIIESGTAVGSPVTVSITTVSP